MTRSVEPDEVFRAIRNQNSNLLDLSIPVFVDSELPRPNSGMPLVIQTGVASDLGLIASSSLVAEFEDSQGFRLSVSTSKQEGNDEDLGSAKSLVVSQGDPIVASGSGLAPNSNAVVWLFSEPRRLTVIEVDTDGNFSGQGEVASDVQVGRHTIQINGITDQGELRSVNIAVEVVAIDPVTDIERSSEVAADSGDESLDSTTSDGKFLELLLIVTIALLGAGIFVLLLINRRRNKDDSR